MTPTLISAFLTYTLITALTPGPNNILALSSVTAHGFRRSMRVLAGMSLGFVIIMLICAGLTFTLVTLDEGITSLLRWAGGAACQLLGQPGAAVCECKNYPVRHHGPVDLCSAGDSRAILAGDNKPVAISNRRCRQSLLGAGRSAVSAGVRTPWKRVKSAAGAAAGLVRGTNVYGMN